MTEHINIGYASYVLISVAMTVWVARTLHRNGRIFLVDAFGGNAPLADAVNHLLVVGFYLLNFGFIAFFLRTVERISTTRDTIEFLSFKLGVVMLVLGGMHLINVYVFSKMRRHAMLLDSPPPVRPSARTTIASLS